MRTQEEKSRSLPRFINALALDTIMRPMPHSMAVTVTNADPEDQDAMIDFLLNHSREVLLEKLRDFLTEPKRANSDFGVTSSISQRNGSRLVVRR